MKNNLKEYAKNMTNNLIPVEVIENKIYIIRGHKVMLDSDLATLYDVETKVLNQAVKRNLERFPSDFMFQLTKEEFENLKSQIVTSSWGGKRKLPYVFTEQGVAMLSGVLHSKRAIAVNIQIMRTFTKLRGMISTNNDLAKRLDDLEKHFIKYAQENNIYIEDIYKQLNYLKDITKPDQIGFKTE